MFDLFASFGRRRKGRSADSLPSRRRLSLESLETRRPLAGDLVCTPPPPPPSDPVYFDPSSVPTPPAVVAPPPESPIAAPPTPPPANTPPKIVTFTTLQLLPIAGGFLWEVQGVVEDDALASGVTVRIAVGDKLYQAPADKVSGSFSTSLVLPVNFEGRITATATDAVGAISVERTIYIY